MPRGHVPAAAVELDAQQRRVIGRQHPDIAGYGCAIVVVTTSELEEHLRAAITQLVDGVNARERESFENVVQSALESVPAATPSRIADGQRQAQFRHRVIQDYGAYTAAEVGIRAGSSAINPAKLVSQWRQSRRLLGVPYNGAKMYLAFQFGDDGRPLPIMATVLRELRGWDDWEIAAWFVLANGLLEQQRPADLLRSDPDRVLEAAKLDARIRTRR